MAYPSLNVTKRGRPLESLVLNSSSTLKINCNSNINQDSNNNNSDYNDDNNNNDNSYNNNNGNNIIIK